MIYIRTLFQIIIVFSFMICGVSHAGPVFKLCPRIFTDETPYSAFLKPISSSQQRKIRRAVVAAIQETVDGVRIVSQRDESVFYPYDDGFAQSRVFTVKTDDHEFDISVPLTFLNDSENSLAISNLMSALSGLPVHHLDAVKGMRINLTPFKPHAATAALLTNNNSIIDFFPQSFPLLRDAKASLMQHWNLSHLVRHEFGHALAIKYFRVPTPSPAYIRQAVKDAFIPSSYATTWSEDFAEAVAFYLLAQEHPGSQIHRQLKNRFAFLEQMISAKSN